MLSPELGGLKHRRRKFITLLGQPRLRCIGRLVPARAARGFARSVVISPTHRTGERQGLNLAACPPRLERNRLRRRQKSDDRIPLGTRPVRSVARHWRLIWLQPSHCDRHDRRAPNRHGAAQAGNADNSYCFASGSDPCPGTTGQDLQSARCNTTGVHMCLPPARKKKAEAASTTVWS